MNFVEDITVTSLDEIRAYNITTGDYMFTLDELQDATISNTEDKVDITGRAGRKLSTIKRNKAVTVSGTNGMLSTGLMGVQTGSNVEDGTFEIDFVEIIDINDDDGGSIATLAKAPVENSGVPVIDQVYFVDDNNILVRGALGKVASGTTPAEGEYYAAKADGKTSIKFNGTEVEAGGYKKAAVFYRRSVTGKKVTNTDTISTGKYALYIDGTAENKCGDVFHIQFHIPKADFSGNFDIALGGDQVVHAFEADALAGGCGSNNSEFWDYIIFGEAA